MARDTFEKSAQVRPSFVGRTWRGAKAAVRMSFSGTFAAFPAAAIRENARVIRLLFNQVPKRITETGAFERKTAGSLWQQPPSISR